MNLSIELNVTLACNARCRCCDRLCDKFPERTEHMEVCQVERFLTEARLAGGVSKVRVLGGEPTLHPQIDAIMRLLVDAIHDGTVGAVEVNTNTISPTWKAHRDACLDPKVRWDRSPPNRKHHLPFLWAPKDLGFATTGPCRHPVQCGFSLDSLGWLPCSPAIAITRLFFGGRHYRQAMPDGTAWGCEDLCPLCIYSMPRGWRIRNRRKLRDFTAAMKEPTRSWADALKEATQKAPAEASQGNPNG